MSRLLGVFIVVVIVTLLGQQLRADDAERIEYLISLLASKNTVPAESARGHRNSEPTADYRKADQAIVYLAIQQLLHEDNSLDYLMKHMDDARYALTYESPSGHYDMSVGKVCSQMFHVRACCYLERGLLKNFTSVHYSPYKPDRESLAAWWKQNRDKPLWKIQIESIDGEINLLEKLDLSRIPPPHPYAARRPVEELEKARAANLETLRALRGRIEASERAYAPGSIEGTYMFLTWLPWSTPSFGM